MGRDFVRFLLAMRSTAVSCCTPRSTSKKARRGTLQANNKSRIALALKHLSHLSLSYCGLLYVGSVKHKHTTSSTSTSLPLRLLFSFDAETNILCALFFLLFNIYWLHSCAKKNVLASCYRPLHFASLASLLSNFLLSLS